MSKFKRKVLERLVDDNKIVTIIITSGANCCELTGCVGEVADDYLTLLTPDNACNRTYIALDCICAVSERIEPPPPPPPPPVCECQVTGAANIPFPDPPCSPDVVRLTVVACPGCTPEPDQVLYEDTRGEEDVELMLLPPGPGEITSVSCVDDQAAIIEGTAQVTIGGVNQGICEFILEVTDTPPPTPDTLRMLIICDGIEVHDSGVVDLLGQSINIIEC
ncbi:hypothetical protein MWH28_06675 [Natroniella sulfidigena]|uniref:hypothetical protein n=1 Tax=Natroniella sulfidigena TaxID=723921 RepID=UPI00200B7AE8|nr:hypothetical protein [Natroniella sulfidigena]MCK8817056.1 hypothetical protein [Natroniella sulfidigena]